MDMRRLDEIRLIAGKTSAAVVIQLAGGCKNSLPNHDVKKCLTFAQLLDEEGWRDLRQYADYTVMIRAEDIFSTYFQLWSCFAGCRTLTWSR